MFGLDPLDTIFVVWAFFLQIVLIIHFAIRKPLFTSYTQKFGWGVYALCLPGAIISGLLVAGGKSWSFWMGGLIFLIWAAYGYRVDYIQKINWRKPLRKEIMFPYLTLYLGTIMFHWWPLAQLHRPLWVSFGILFVIGTILNLTTH